MMWTFYRRFIKAIGMDGRDGEFSFTKGVIVFILVSYPMGWPVSELIAIVSIVAPQSPNIAQDILKIVSVFAQARIKAASFAATTPPSEDQVHVQVTTAPREGAG